MYRQIKPLIVLVGLFVAVFLVMMPASGQSQLTATSKLAINGIGPIRVGMTIQQAEASARTRLVSQGDKLDNCWYVKPQGGPTDISFMVIDGKIARVDIYGKSRITTISGAKIGDSENRIKSLYAVRITPHEYVQGGHYLTFIPNDTSDRQYRLVFETDGRRVKQFRSGRLPEVEYVEGCA
ncbi:MAG: hypothetical protein AB1589_21505 [Cyanobacteriota bacterium]